MQKYRKQMKLAAKRNEKNSFLPRLLPRERSQEARGVDLLLLLLSISALALCQRCEQRGDVDGGLLLLSLLRRRRRRRRRRVSSPLPLLRERRERGGKLVVSLLYCFLVDLHILEEHHPRLLLFLLLL